MSLINELRLTDQETETSRFAWKCFLSAHADECDMDAVLQTIIDAVWQMTLLQFLKNDMIVIKCLKCDGTGWKPEESGRPHGDIDCPKCKGTGYLDKEKLIKELEGVKHV
jgi:hypothetical protein